MADREGGNERGAALLTAIFYALIISLLAASIVSVFHVRALVEARQADHVRALLLVKTAQSIGVLQVTKYHAGLEITADDRNVQCAFPEGIIELRIEDEAGKIDLNTGSLVLLERFLDSLAAHALFEHIRDVRAEGRLFSHVGEATRAVPGTEERDLILGRTITVYARSPSIDIDEISTGHGGDLLRAASVASGTAILTTPRRVFRFDISVRTQNGLAFGRTIYIRTMPEGEGFETLASLPGAPMFETVPGVSDELCRAFL